MMIELTTKHLKIRLFSDDDLDNIITLNADPEVRRFFPGGVATREQTITRMAEVKALYESQGYPSLVIYDNESDEFIGRCGFSLFENNEIEVGYLIDKKFWGLGYATEALKAILEWAADNIDAKYIIAFTPIEHKASQRVMEKCGMQFYQNSTAHGVDCRFYRIRNIGRVS